MSDWPDIAEEDAVRVAEYALGLSAAPERRAVEARLAGEPRLRGELAAWDAALAPMAAEVAPVTPPARLRRALETRLFGAEQRREAGGALRFWQAVSALALACVAVLAVLLAEGAGPGERPAPAYIVEITGPESELRLAAALGPAGDMLRLNRATGGAPAGRTLELWLIAGEDAAPVSLGLLPRDRRGRITIPPDLVQRLPGASLAVSSEPPGGSPTGAPTGPVLGTGTITPL